MLSTPRLLERTTVEPRLITMVYGTDAPPLGSSAPTGLITDKDRSVKDTQKAEWTHSGGQHGHKRPFYGLDAYRDDAEAITQLAQKDLDQYIIEQSG
jgi:hypothetical protein